MLLKLCRTRVYLSSAVEEAEDLRQVGGGPVAGEIGSVAEVRAVQLLEEEALCLAPSLL